MANIDDLIDPRVDLAVAGVRKTFGGRAVLHDVDLRVSAGSVVALLGPSGCGKTTLLRTIAGLEVPDAGSVRIGGRTLTDGARVVVPPERRRVGMVFQDWALFPHLTVAANVGYGLPRAERRGPRVRDALALVGLEGLGGRLPGTLSGGQQQRVALARALAPRPSVMLFDEPFSNFDSALRARVRSEVHKLLGDLGITSLFVTHDQQEAFVLGDEVAVMHDGRIVQQAPPSVLYDTPATPWIADFVGDANLLAGDARDGHARTVLGRLPLRDRSLRGDVLVLVRPEQIRLGAGTAGIVDRVEEHGHDAVVVVTIGNSAPLEVRVPGVAARRRGDRVELAYAGSGAVAYPIAAPSGLPDAAAVTESGEMSEASFTSAVGRD